MTIDEQNKKYREVIINCEKKKLEMLAIINKYYNDFLEAEYVNKDYYFSNVMQILMLLEKINEKIEDVKLNIQLNDIRKRFRAKYFTDIDRYKNIGGLTEFKTQYKIELYKMMAIDDMDSEEYQEQVNLVKKYKKLVIGEKDNLN